MQKAYGEFTSESPRDYNSWLEYPVTIHMLGSMAIPFFDGQLVSLNQGISNRISLHDASVYMGLTPAQHRSDQSIALESS